MKQKKNKLINFAPSNDFPFLIYLRNGNLLKTYGVDKDNIFETTYYSLYKETKDCYILRLLTPIKFCEQFLLKYSPTTVTVKKECILGIQDIYDIKVANTLVVHQHYNDCIRGNFQIAKGYLGTTIWQSNLDDNYTGEAQLTYTVGTEAFTNVKITYKNYSSSEFKLFKVFPLTIDLDAVQTIEITKLKKTQITGTYKIDINIETETKLKL